MVQFFNAFLKQGRNVFGKLHPKQKIVIGFVSIFSVVLIIFLMNWVSEKQFVVLFSGLEAGDAQVIIDRLNEENIPYRLQEEGNTILVPEGTELRMRLQLASEGIPASGGVGYEIFDRTSLGMTDFVQKLNFRRALEGEISRTIRSIDAVATATVRIVMPETALFVEDKEDATAAVLLGMKSSASLSNEQIVAIGNLVASSVEGLRPENITIIDNYGNLLSEELNKDPLIALTANQIELQAYVANEYRKTIESQLSMALGPNNAIVRVNVEMDFKQHSEYRESFNPDVRVVRSEERNEQGGGTIDTTQTASTSEVSTTNYEVNKTTENIIDNLGKIKRVTVSVMVNGTYTGQGDQRTYVPRTQQVLTNITQMVQNAVGYDIDRQDDVIVIDYQFDTTIRDEERRRQTDEQRTEMMQKILRWTLMSVAGLAFLIVLRSIFKSLDMLLPKPKPKPAIDIEAEAIEEEISAEAQRRAQMLEQVSKFTKEKPANVAALLNTWLIGEEK